ncbi:MAG: hypothetical protein NT161_00930 [Candidatus Nomurabacteria bacterium]|nr:hypothetical protein [Candidatus Nomurabacteria bacterium]
MVDNFFRKKLFFLGFLIPVVFGASLVFAANPTNFLSPTGNILDPGAVNTPWGGCGPFDANCYTARKISNSVNSSQPPTGIINRAPTQTVSAVSNQAVLSALRNLLASGLPTDLLAKLRGPAGPAGPKGDSGITTVINTSTNLPSVSLPGAVIPPNPTTYYPGGSLFSATDLSSTNFITTTAKIVTLTVSGNTTFTGDLSVGGTLASVGNSTLATGASTTNTFGSGASSANTIGSTTTPGTLTLHGATTLDNTFSQTGANTFGTGTGAISLNGAVTVTGANTFTTGTGTVEFKNVSTNISSTNPVIDVTSASTLFINSVTNRPVSFGTGLVTANNFGSSSVAITGGTITGTTINNSTIGVTTPVAGNFTTIGVTTPGSATFTTIGTGTTNTFGSGASSANTIGSTTTPGTLTLHGATTLDNTFSQTGANTFGTGTGAVTLNGQTEIKKNLTIPVTTGSTVGVIYSGADRFIHTYAKTGSEGQNTFVGVNAGNFTMGPPTGGDPTDMGSFNTAIGYQSLTSNTTGAYNSALGFRALAGNTEGNFNSAVGYLTMNDNTTGSSNSTLGYSALQYNTTGSYNVALGYLAGRLIANGGDLTDPENSIYIGYGARAFSNADDNSIVIGFNAVGIGANTVVLGNDSILTTALKGNVTIPANKNLTMTSGTGQFSTGTGAISLNGAVTVTGANTFTTGTGTVEFKNVSTNISSTNPVIDVTSASTLFINSVTNRPVSFGTGLVTANNFGSSSVAITGGTIVGTTINNSTIGVTTPGSATFTTITSSGNSTLATGTGTTNTVLVPPTLSVVEQVQLIPLVPPLLLAL